MNEYFQVGSVPAPNSPGASSVVRQEFTNIASGFDKLPVMAGHAGEIVAINGTGTSLVASGVVLGDFVTMTGAQTLTNKTIAWADNTFPGLAAGIGINLKADAYNAVLTGAPSAPTPPIGDASARLATTYFVTNTLAAIGSVIPGNDNPVMDGIASPGIDPAAVSRQDHVHPSDTSRAPASAGTATGTSFTPTGNIAATNVQLALQELDAEKAPLASPGFTGVPTAPTVADSSDTTTKIATTAWVQTRLVQIPVGVSLSDSTPVSLAVTATPGVGVEASRYDHVHVVPAASQIPNTPAGTIAATNVQAALNELDSETQAALALKLAKTGGYATPSAGTTATLGAVNAVDAGNAGYIDMVSGTVSQKLRSGKTGLGVALPLDIEVGGTLVARATSDGNLALAGTVVQGSASGFRNKLINGDMRVWQRTTTPTLSIGSTLTADRWIVYCGGAAGTCQRTYSSTGGFGDGTAATLINMFGASGNTALQLVQRIESDNAASLRGKLCTVSAWVSTSDSRSVEIYLSHANAKDNFTSTTLISRVSTAASAGWRKLVTTFLVPNTIFGLELGLVFGAVPGGVECAATQVQLEEGSVATPFEQRPYGLELSLCQRYYEIGKSGFSGNITAGFNYYAQQQFKVTKRSSPSILLTTVANAGFPAVASTVGGASTESFDIYRPSNGTGVGYFFDTWTADAEL